MTAPAPTIGDAAIAILNSARPEDKIQLSHRHAKGWIAGELSHAFPANPPNRPARPATPELLMPRYMPKRRNVTVLLHAIAHIEFNAIDLAWDMVARFGQDMPKEFTDDWVRVADDEARHFQMLIDRLQAYGAIYGDMPAHDGLWQSAMDTAHDLLARIAIVPLVLEARGLDVTPAIIARLTKAEDTKSAEILTLIYDEEISHVHAGQKWFNYLCERQNFDPVKTYQKLVQQYFKGQIKPPFNKEARSRAGFEEKYYLPLAQEKN
ncbi:MAG: rhamnosyltransferase [Alphaproteobacteria bacterium]|nr:MAG: rhamnosyltransferase [Alphaproteobacteria bacterium]